MMKGRIDLHHDRLKGKSPGDIGSNPIREKKRQMIFTVVALAEQGRLGH